MVSLSIACSPNDYSHVNDYIKDLSESSVSELNTSVLNLPNRSLEHNQNLNEALENIYIITLDDSFYLIYGNDVLIYYCDSDFHSSCVFNLSNDAVIHSGENSNCCFRCYYKVLIAYEMKHNMLYLGKHFDNVLPCFYQMFLLNISTILISEISNITINFGIMKNTEMKFIHSFFTSNYIGQVLIICTVQILLYL